MSLVRLGVISMVLLAVIAASYVPAGGSVTGMPGPASLGDDDGIARVSVDELILLLAKKKPVTIIDTRSLDSYDQKIKGALQIPADQIESRITEIPRGPEVIIYCA